MNIPLHVNITLLEVIDVILRYEQSWDFQKFNQIDF